MHLGERAGNPDVGGIIRSLLVNRWKIHRIKRITGIALTKRWNGQKKQEY
jgi:hypothetical protein